ncbi:AmpG family muropeptide MFS transporter [Alphaproteobacteria bacterium]|nr:AmpG family muropeptide MFS transporter [Alphaproteobacteria bacterium]
MSLTTNIKQVILKPRILVMLILGFSAGIPLLMVFSTLSAWLKEAGVSRAEIGFASWVGLAYGFKYLWSPLVDKLKIPYLTDLLGRRRSWMLISQIGVIIGIMGMAYSDPKYMLTYSILFAVVLSFSSATQDIVIDAFRIDTGKQDEQAIMAALYVYGYRIAMLLSGAGVLYLTDTGANYDYEVWKRAYSYMALAILPCTMFVLFLLKEPIVETKTYENLNDFFNQAFVQPFADFFERYGKGFLILLGIAITFRISDLLMAVMANPFYLEIGFTKTEIAFAVKTFGFWMTIIGLSLGGLLLSITGMRNTLIIVALLTASSNLLFSVISVIGNNLNFLVLTIMIDNLASGMAATVFIAFLSSIVNKEFSATQYALLSSFIMLIPKFIAGYSGVIVDNIGYSWFWISTALAGIPTIIFIIMGSRLLNVNK